MVTPRLTFLYPIFCHGPIVTECGPLRTSVRQRSSRNSKIFSTSLKRRDAVQQEEYKPGTEPPPQVMNKKSQIGRNINTQKSTQEKEQEKPRQGRRSGIERPARDSSSSEDKTTSNAPELLPKESQEAKAQETTILADSPPPTQSMPLQNPIDTVLNMPSPGGQSPDDKPPHLQPPPYVHHFDTWSLVQDLNKGGFSQHQSISLMKAVRAILTDNMDLARRGLISKSNVENETYLFRAACSELRTEIQNNRKAEMEKQRTQRAQLQHEVDILNQRMAQETLNLKDELKGMFDDRKMAAKMEQRSMESRIQELNYKITIALDSDAKSDVESVRWVLTRRAAAALGISVVMILSALNYSKYMTHTQEKERMKFAEDMQEAGTQGRDGTSGEELLARDGVS